ncbi:MAG: hypothetical protein MI757_04610 [Pirellulales bacterium]|nr:hypothetical protein [Pirellulales bacterium]
MLKTELAEMLEQRPFVPIEIHLSNGRRHTIRHPEMAIIGRGTLAIAVMADDGENDISLCSIDHIAEAKQQGEHSES